MKATNWIDVAEEQLEASIRNDEDSWLDISTAASLLSIAKSLKILAHR